MLIQLPTRRWFGPSLRAHRVPVSSFQYSHLAQIWIIIQISTPEPSLATSKCCSGVQDTTVVKDHTLTRFHLSFVHSPAQLCQISEHLRCLMPRSHAFGQCNITLGMVKRCLEWRCPVDRLHICPDLIRTFRDMSYTLLQLERTSTAEIMVVVVVVVEVDWRFHESLECSPVQFVKLLHGQICITEQRNTTLRGCTETMKELQSWRLLHV